MYVHVRRGLVIFGFFPIPYGPFHLGVRDNAFRYEKEKIYYRSWRRALRVLFAFFFFCVMREFFYPPFHVKKHENKILLADNGRRRKFICVQVPLRFTGSAFEIQNNSRVFYCRRAVDESNLEIITMSWGIS